MSFKRFVETGRIVYVAHGPNKGKLCSIVDIIDQTRVLVDGPLTGVERQGIRINQINLTKFVLKFPRSGGSGIVKKAWKEAKIDERWSKSRWAKNIANKRKRLGMTDFDRFKLKGAIQRRNRIRSEQFFILRKQAYRKNALYGMKKGKKTDQMREAAKAKSIAKSKRLTLLKQRRAAKGLDVKAPQADKPAPKEKAAKSASKEKAAKSASKEKAAKSASKEKAAKPAPKEKAAKPAPKEKAAKPKEKPAPKK